MLAWSSRDKILCSDQAVEWAFPTPYGNCAAIWKELSFRSIQIPKSHFSLHLVPSDLALALVDVPGPNKP